MRRVRVGGPDEGDRVVQQHALLGRSEPGPSRTFDEVEAEALLLARSGQLMEAVDCVHPLKRIRLHLGDGAPDLFEKFGVTTFCLAEIFDLLGAPFPFVGPTLVV